MTARKALQNLAVVAAALGVDSVPEPDSWSPPKPVRSEEEQERKRVEAEIKRLRKALKRCAPQAREALEEKIRKLDLSVKKA
jgi:vacuolar-type H+-ATPase subunit I/STV1